MVSTEALERDPNPFAAGGLGAAEGIGDTGAPAERGRWKVRLIKELYDRGLGAEQIRQLLRLNDWLLDAWSDAGGGYGWAVKGILISTRTRGRS
jgi:hypothetical protein